LRIVTLLAIILLAFVITPIAYAHYPHTSDECATTEQLGSREKCLLEQRESGKEIKFVDMYFSEDIDVGGNEGDEIPKKIEVEPGDGVTTLAAVMANSGPFELTGMRAWLSLPLGFQAAGRPAGEPAFDTFDLGIAPGATFVFEFPVVVTESTRVGMYSATLHVEYFKARDIGLNFRDFNIEFLLPGRTVINAVIDEPVIPTITPTPLTVSIYNRGTGMVSSAEVTVSTPITATVALNQQVPEASTSPIMIRDGDGYTKINTIKPGEKADIKITLFASEGAVNTAFQLPVTINYIDPNGITKQIQRFVSVYVQGTISLRINDFGITYIGNEPNISGYLLNEGTNLALFTTVELIDNQDVIKQVGVSQYLGDLTANSPLPFNIPVRFAEGTSAGSYPVTVKVTYKDDLRVPFEKEIDGIVQYTPLVVKESESPSIFSNMGIIAGIGAAGAGGAGYYFVRRKMKTPAWAEGKSKVDSDDDLDFLSESKQS
jgi:hypothetical protein